MATFTDALQRPIHMTEPPKRVVSLVPSITEALFTFGADDSIVGVTQFCVEPADRVAGKEKVGGTKTLDVARVKQLEPDLIIANAEENRQEDVRQLIAAGLNVFVTFPRTVTHAIDMMRQLAMMTGTMDVAGAILQDAEEALTEVRTASERRKPLRAFCPIWRNPWMTVGPNTYMHDLLASCGAANIFNHRHERYPRVELHEVARRDPEVIFLPDEPYHFVEKHIEEFRKYENVSAVQNGRIFLLEGKHLGWYGPRIAGSLRYVRDLLWGDTAGVETEERRIADPQSVGL